MDQNAHRENSLSYVAAFDSQMRIPTFMALLVKNITLSKQHAVIVTL